MKPPRVLRRCGSRLHCLYRYDWETTDAYDVHWKFIDREIRVAYFSGLDPDVDPELGHRVTPEARGGVTHLLIGGLDFVRTEDYGPYNDADFPFPHALGMLSQGGYVQSSPDFFDTIDNVIIDRVTGILVLKPE